MLVCKRFIKICILPFSPALDLEGKEFSFLYSRSSLELLTGEGRYVFSKSRDQSLWLIISQLPKSSTANERKNSFPRRCEHWRKKTNPVLAYSPSLMLSRIQTYASELSFKCLKLKTLP